MRGGQPSTTQPIAGPWLSPKVVTRKSWPKVLKDMGCTGSPVSYPAGLTGSNDRRLRGRRNERYSSLPASLFVRLNHDLNIPVKPGQKFHEPIDRVFPKVASEQARHLGLADAHALSGLCLGELALPRQAVDFRDDLRLEQVGLGVG